MSHIYIGNFLFIPAMCNVLSFSVAPIVVLLLLGIQPLTNLLSIAVLPTPESPTITTFLNAKDAVFVDLKLPYVSGSVMPSFMGPPDLMGYPSSSCYANSLYLSILIN